MEPVGNDRVLTGKGLSRRNERRIAPGIDHVAVRIELDHGRRSDRRLERSDQRTADDGASDAFRRRETAGLETLRGDEYVVLDTETDAADHTRNPAAGHGGRRGHAGRSGHGGQRLHPIGIDREGRRLRLTRPAPQTYARHRSKRQRRSQDRASGFHEFLRDNSRT